MFLVKKFRKKSERLQVGTKREESVLAFFMEVAISTNFSSKVIRLQI